MTHAEPIASMKRQIENHREAGDTVGVEVLTRELKRMKIAAKDTADLYDAEMDNRIARRLGK